MRTLRILPLMVLGMTCQAAAQTIADATSVSPPVVRDSGRVATRPAANTACGPWLEGCLGEDRGRVLLFLGLVSATKRPLLPR